jgi:hypothetical protein
MTSPVIMLEVQRYLEAPVHIVAQRTTPLSHLYAKVRGAMFPISHYNPSSYMTQGAALQMLWGQDDIPVNTTIHDLFAFSPTLDRITSIPLDDEMTLGEFMDENPSHFECSSKNTRIHSTYTIYVIDENGLQMLVNEKQPLSNKHFTTSIKTVAKKILRFAACPSIKN